MSSVGAGAQASYPWWIRGISGHRLPATVAVYAVQMGLLLIAFLGVPNVVQTPTGLLATSAALALIFQAGSIVGRKIRPSERFAPEISASLPRVATSDADATFRGVSGRLVRWWGLDVYGNSLLSRRGATYLQASALLLSTTSLLQLFTFVVVSQSLLQEVFSQPLAMTLSALSSIVLTLSVSITERSILTGERSYRNWIRYVIHIVLAGLIASLMGTATELRLANTAIDARLQSEQQLRRIVSRVVVLQRTGAEIAPATVEQIRREEMSIRSDQNRTTVLDRLRAFHDMRDGLPVAQSINASQAALRLLRELGYDFSQNAPPSRELVILHWLLFALFWMLSTTSVLIRLVAPRDIDFYFDLDKQAAYYGLTWRQAVVEDTRATRALVPIAVTAG